MSAELHLCPSRKVTGNSFQERQDHKQELERDGDMFSQETGNGTSFWDGNLGVQGEW